MTLHVHTATTLRNSCNISLLVAHYERARAALAISAHAHVRIRINIYAYPSTLAA